MMHFAEVARGQARLTVEEFVVDWLLKSRLAQGLRALRESLFRGRARYPVSG